MVNRVKFEITAGLYVEFLNYITDNDIYISDIKATEFGFTAYCMAKYYKKIAKAARKFQCRIKIVKKTGIWFKMRKLIRRKGLFVGAAISALLVVFFTNLIWRIDVITADKNITQDVYTMLYKNGIHAGAYFNQDKNQEVIQLISKNVNNVAYVTMNFYKGILTCKVDHTINKMPYLENQTSGNITAALDGVIEELEVYNGFSEIKIGQSVQQGELLVSATFIDRNGTLQQVMPRAYIKAYCEKQYTAFVPFEKTANIRTGRFAEQSAIKFMRMNFKVGKSKDNPFGFYDAEKTYSDIILFGFRLPLTKETVRYYEKAAVLVNKNADTAKATANIIVNTLIKSDKSLIKADKKDYTYYENEEGITVLCKIYGHYDITK